jgi:predicted AlkP superfamily phosphohydrolase/phosphomutase
VLISGFVAIELEKAVYPSSLLPKLNEFGYRIDIDTSRARDDHEFLIQELNETLRTRKKTVDYLWDKEDWDLFIVVITGTDRLHHFLFDAYRDENHPYHQAFINYYQEIDKFIGDIYEKYTQLKAEKVLFMLSDHGFTQLKTEVYINRWLYENRYLKFNSNPPKIISDLGAGTVAFALDPSRIYINLKNKYPLGTVDKKDYEHLCEELKQVLLEIKYDGMPVLRNVFHKEEIYRGPYIEQAPDLVLLSNPGFDLKASVQQNTLFGRRAFQGMHTYDDAFYFCDRKIECETIFELKAKIIQ